MVKIVHRLDLNISNPSQRQGFEGLVTQHKFSAPSKYIRSLIYNYADNTVGLQKTTLKEEFSTDCVTESESTRVTNNGLPRMSTSTIINCTDSLSVLQRTLVLL